MYIIFTSFHPHIFMPVLSTVFAPVQDYIHDQCSNSRDWVLLPRSGDDYLTFILYGNSVYKNITG